MAADGGPAAVELCIPFSKSCRLGGANLALCLTSIYQMQPRKCGGGRVSTYLAKLVPLLHMKQLNSCISVISVART
jgi:hypothetical protein